MRHIKEPEGVDFIINGKPLTKEKEVLITNYIQAYKAKNNAKCQIRLRKQSLRLKIYLLLHCLTLSSCARNDDSITNRKYVGFLSDSLYLGQSFSDIKKIKNSIYKNYEISSDKVLVYLDESILDTSKYNESTISTYYYFQIPANVLVGINIIATYSDNQMDIPYALALFKEKYENQLFWGNGIINAEKMHYPTVIYEAGDVRYYIRGVPRSQSKLNFKP